MAARQRLSAARDVNVTGGSQHHGTAVGFVHSWSDKAPEPHASRLQTFAAKQLATLQTFPSGSDAPIGRTDVLRWKASDAMDIEGLLTYPIGYEKGRRVPLLVIVHGGPAGVYTRSFVGTANPYPITAFSERGYAVLRVNPRGSSGYGRKFRYANYRDWGGGDYRDIMAGVDHVIGLGVADPDRLGIMGWSYGGYMTSWVITQTKRFKAASVGAGVTNLMSFTGTAAIPGFVPDYFGGEYWGCVRSLASRSADVQVKGVATPTRFQRANRIGACRSRRLRAVQRAHAAGRSQKMVVYPRQPHGLLEPKFIKDAMERNLEWFDRWIKSSAQTSSAEAGRR